MIAIRQFVPQEWKRYQELRLRALADSPDAFGSTYEVESQRSDGHWQQRLQEAASSASTLPLVAEEGDVAVGLCWGKIDPEVPGLAHVFQMWVAPSWRGQGIASRLLEAVLDWAKEAGAERVTLNVACGNVVAERIYARAGFVATGEARRLREGSALMVQTMGLTLGAQPRRLTPPAMQRIVGMPGDALR